MDKNRMIEILKEKGYHAYVEKHILMVGYFGANMPLKEVREILEENGYMASFGLVKSKNMTEYLPESDDMARAV